MWVYVNNPYSVVLDPALLIFIAIVVALVLVFAADRDSEGNYLGPSTFSKFLSSRRNKKK